MTVTVNAATENVRTLTTSPQTFSHAGAASGVKGVVLALVHGTSSTDHVTAASYGGVALTRIQRNTDTATEPGAAELWFLGTGVPQGTQNASYTPGSTTDDFHAVCITLLGAADLEVVTQGGIDNNVANPSVTLAYGGRTCMSFAALYGGGAAPTSFTPNANCTTIHDHDLGAFYSGVIRQTTAGSANFDIGGTSATDDVAFAAIAVSEVQNNVVVTPGTLALSLAAFAPVVTATANVLVTAGLIALSLSTFAATVTATDHKLVTPGTASLSLATFAPTVGIGVVATPLTASLATSAFAPDVAVTNNQFVTPETVALATSTFAPTVTASDHKTATPTTASLATAALAPTVSVSDNNIVTPDTASLAVTAYAPTVTAAQNLVVTPDVATLATATFAPTVTASDHKTVAPDTAALSTSTFAPTVTAGGGVTVTPATLALSTTLFAPDVTAGSGVVVTPATLALSITAFTPIVWLERGGGIRFGSGVSRIYVGSIRVV